MVYPSVQLKIKTFTKHKFLISKIYYNIVLGNDLQRINVKNILVKTHHNTVYIIFKLKIYLDVIALLFDY